MADNNQELIKKDLTYIIQLNTKTNYKNSAEVQRTHNFALQKNLFKTTLGQRYMKRLEQIIDGTATSNNCVLCNKVLDNSSLVCTSCLTKYKLTPAKQENTKTPLQRENNAEQRGSVTSGQTSAVQHAVNREQNIAARPKAKTKKKFSKKTIIIALAVMVFIGGLISEDGGTSGGDLINMLGMTQSQVEKQYGKADSVESNALSDNLYNAYYNEGFWYTASAKVGVQTIFLNEGTRTLAGVSIGDDIEKVDAIMKEQGGRLDSEYVASSISNLFSGEPNTLVRTYKTESNTIDISFDYYNSTVVSVMAR